MATPIVTPHIRQRAEQLAEQAPTWPRGRSKVDGRAFYVIPSSSKPETVAHYANHLGCSCPSFRHRGVCCHQQACLLLVQRQEAPRVEAVQQARADFGSCVSKGCTNAAANRGRRCKPCLGRLGRELGIAE